MKYVSGADLYIGISALLVQVRPLPAIHRTRLCRSAAFRQAAMRSAMSGWVLTTKML